MNWSSPSLPPSPSRSRTSCCRSSARRCASLLSAPHRLRHILFSSAHRRPRSAAPRSTLTEATNGYPAIRWESDDDVVVVTSRKMSDVHPSWTQDARPHTLTACRIAISETNTTSRMPHPRPVSCLGLGLEVRSKVQSVHNFFFSLSSRSLHLFPPASSVDAGMNPPICSRSSTSIPLIFLLQLLPLLQPSHSRRSNKPSPCLERLIRYQLTTSHAQPSCPSAPLAAHRFLVQSASPSPSRDPFTCTSSISTSTTTTIIDRSNVTLPNAPAHLRNSRCIVPAVSLGNARTHPCCSTSPRRHTSSKVHSCSCLYEWLMSLCSSAPSSTVGLQLPRSSSCSLCCLSLACWPPPRLRAPVQAPSRLLAHPQFLSLSSRLTSQHGLTLPATQKRASWRVLIPISGREYQPVILGQLPC